MKKIILIILVLIGVIVISPYFIGSMAESQIREQVEKLNSHPTYNMTIASYHKGWFNSDAKIELVISMPTDSISKPPLMHAAFNKLTINQTIQHGPVLWQGSGLGFGLMDAEIDFQLASKLLEDLKRVEGMNQKVLSIITRTTFDLATNIDFKLNPFEIQENDTRFKIQQGHGHLNYDMAGHIEGKISWQGMSISKQNIKVFDLGKLTINTKQLLVSGDIFSPTALFNGYFTSHLAKLSIKQETSLGDLALNDFNLNVTSKINEDLANVGVILDVKSLGVIQQSFSDLVYDFSLENLDVDSLNRMNQLIGESQGQTPLMISAKMQSVLPQLVVKGPLLKINKLGLITKDGAVDSNLAISIDQSIYDINNPMTMVLAIVAKAEGYAPEAFLNSLGMAEAIEQMLQKNMLVRDQKNVRFELTFNNGQALLNGSPLPLGNL